MHTVLETRRKPPYLDNALQTKTPIILQDNRHFLSFNSLLKENYRL